ncbi:MAG: sodium ion-translocating decarboxylase subunit beta, partial [Desulfobacterales bacterium]|nr:sodium ion-translocating decarboxylase subunit beta [Desulfobacterales bacterium]
MTDLLIEFLSNTGFALVDYRNIIMLLVGIIIIYLGVAKQYEPLLLVPIGFGILIGNIPIIKDFGLGIYESGSFLNYVYYGVTHDIYPPLIFLGIGALTDFSTMLARPVLMLLGAAAQIGI